MTTPLTIYDPTWKISGTPNLSMVGRTLLISAIKRGDRTAIIRKTFRISSSAVAYWRKWS